jgi:hypothetical protein
MFCSLVAGFVMVVGGAQLRETKAGDVGVSQERPLGSTTYLAHGLCQSWKSKTVTDSCEVDTWQSRIDVTLDTSAAKALEECRQTRDTVARQTNVFEDQGWRLRILAPNGRMLAECGLR